MEFRFAALRRFPDVEAPNLQAWDATDELLVHHALAAAVDGCDIAVIGDEYGAITLALTDAGFRGIRVHQDLVTGRRALARNAAALGLSGSVSHELDRSLLRGARLVLVQLPKALAELEEIADAVARWADPDVVLVAGGRVKHMTLTQNEVLGWSFEIVQAQRAERKSRLIVASGPRPMPEKPPYPQRSEHPDPSTTEPGPRGPEARSDAKRRLEWGVGSEVSGTGITLVSHGGAFAASRIDIGTQVLLEVLAGSQLLKTQTDRPEITPPGHRDDDSEGVMNEPGRSVIDLGCGTGVLAAFYALNNPTARVTATDRSAAAVASARATMAANGLEHRVTVTHDDAGSVLPDASADLILLNPPFHLGASIHTRAATRLFEASARLLRPGGALLTVYNSSLDYKAELSRVIGSTEQLRRTAKFTVTRSIRRR